MRELPLLCKTDVVNNILAGRQTQDRRPVKPQPTGPITWGCIGGQGFGFIDGTKIIKSPFGQPGDLLYVRETWRETGSAQRDDHKIPPADSGVGLDQIIFAAEHPEDGPWRPNIHMPKRFARIWLKVNRVWVERVQDISDDANPWVWACEFERVER